MRQQVLSHGYRFDSSRPGVAMDDAEVRSLVLKLEGSFIGRTPATLVTGPKIPQQAAMGSQFFSQFYGVQLSGVETPEQV